ncbi:heme exporter protein CcmB [Aurantimonas sp. C2-6-R+9]|uniref:heme exporter protein CcmB n=1 Tax=unclassified Aurantimonas TaxID=2638230 RepID=UPI002E1776F2|nr:MULTISPECIES: heme exporter protein CcmB [unclassified Aurantimonas]MEC5289718.1 heme exporter protein CcmB [Aurantimonas sp. C2-3-R2]MEC5379684.1 heme exporter protein CcmB [Aurantimonas sp. C2-6-R+9]MEC5410845.1 heme exporter protein CcmB [Aurantimonas sp. C2-4-R8]
MIALFRRDLGLAFSGGGGAMTGVIFFLAVVATIPFGIGPDLNLLSRIGPAILWIGALLSALLTLDRLFQADRDDGTLDLLIAGPTPLPLVVLAKCLALWVASSLPLVLAAPVLGLFLALDPVAIGAVMATLLAGTPAITFIGAVGAAVAVALPRGGLLVSVLVLPLAIPVLIFGVSATYGAVNDPDPFLSPFLILVALTLFFGALGPIAAGAALKTSAD